MVCKSSISKGQATSRVFQVTATPTSPPLQKVDRYDYRFSSYESSPSILGASEKPLQISDFLGHVNQSLSSSDHSLRPHKSTVETSKVVVPGPDNARPAKFTVYPSLGIVVSYVQAFSCCRQRNMTTILVSILPGSLGKAPGKHWLSSRSDCQKLSLLQLVRLLLRKFIPEIC